MTDCNKRLKNIIFTDKNDTSIKIEKVIKAEIVYLLKNYFKISGEDVSVEINLNKDNMYELKILGVSSQIKNTKLF